VPDDFVIAKNPEPGTSLPYLLRIPVPGRAIVVKAKEMWPRTAKVYCHRAEWPDDAEIVERVRTRACTKRGAAIDLILDRARENRSQFVLTHVRGREAIFWQTARTAKQARPSVRTPSARASGLADLPIIIDAHERYAWKFTDAQVSTTKRALPVGDYAVEMDGQIVAAVERKSLSDLTSSLTTGRLRFVLTELATLPHAAVVVEERYRAIYSLTQVRPAVVADGIAECHARFPTVPIIFAESRSLAEQWTYRFLAACLTEAELENRAQDRLDALATAPPVPAPEPSTAEIRAWAVRQGLASAKGGRLAKGVREAYAAAHPRG